MLDAYEFVTYIEALTQDIDNTPNLKSDNNDIVVNTNSLSAEEIMKRQII